MFVALSRLNFWRMKKKRKELLNPYCVYMLCMKKNFNLERMHASGENKEKIMISYCT